MIAVAFVAVSSVVLDALPLPAAAVTLPELAVTFAVTDTVVLRLEPLMLRDIFSELAAIAVTYVAALLSDALLLREEALLATFAVPFVAALLSDALLLKEEALLANFAVPLVAALLTDSLPLPLLLLLLLLELLRKLVFAAVAFVAALLSDALLPDIMLINTAVAFVAVSSVVLDTLPLPAAAVTLPELAVTFAVTEPLMLRDTFSELAAIAVTYVAALLSDALLLREEALLATFAVPLVAALLSDALPLLGLFAPETLVAPARLSFRAPVTKDEELTKDFPPLLRVSLRFVALLRAVRSLFAVLFSDPLLLPAL
jgi:hypothetical protein